MKGILQEKLTSTRYLRRGIYNPDFDDRNMGALLEVLYEMGFYNSLGDASSQIIKSTLKSGDIFFEFPGREVRVNFEDLYEGSHYDFVRQMNLKIRKKLTQVEKNIKINKRGRNTYGFLQDSKVLIHHYPHEYVCGPFGLPVHVSNKIVNYVNLVLEDYGSEERVFYDFSPMGVLMPESIALMLQKFGYFQPPIPEPVA